MIGLKPIAYGLCFLSVPNVLQGTGLYELWKRGLYRNYAPDKLVDLVARILALLPPWVRVYRIQRDIPMPLVTSGVEKGNLRELALARMAHLGLRCRWGRRGGMPRAVA